MTSIIYLLGINHLEQTNLIRKTTSYMVVTPFKERGQGILQHENDPHFLSSSYVEVLKKGKGKHYYKYMYI